VEIALVGKYTKLQDAYASVIKALSHASLAVNYRLRLTYIAASDLEDSTKNENPVQFHEAWKMLCQCQGKAFYFKN
jgi:CTP synthase